MQPADLNLTRQIIGYQTYLFVHLPSGSVSTEVVRGLDGLGGGMENMHDADGSPTEDALLRGRYQLLRAEPRRSQERDIDRDAVPPGNTQCPYL